MVEKEYERIKKLFDGVDENQLQLVDGVILEAARCKVELDRMHEVIKKNWINPSSSIQCNASKRATSL